VSCSQIWLNPLIADDGHFWSIMKNLRGKKNRKKSQKSPYLDNEFMEVAIKKMFRDSKNKLGYINNLGYLIYSQEIVQYSRTFQPQVPASWNQAHAHLRVQSFP
jgi:hypothetical protein